MTAARAEALLTVAEVAELWRCSIHTVYRHIAAGKLRSLDLGNGRAKTRVPESALAEFMKRAERPTNSRRRAVR